MTQSRRPGRSGTQRRAPDRSRPTGPGEEEIRLRAYAIYLERNGAGDPEQDWLQAERELIEGSSAAR